MMIQLTRFFRLALPFIALGLAACGGNSTPPATYLVGGSLSGLLPGNNITLTNNGKDTLTLSANGAFTFTSKLPAAASYNVTLAAPTPIAQTCTATNSTGSVNASSTTTLNVSCEVNVVAAGQVESAAGEVMATSITGQPRPLHQGDSINEGDTLRSGPKATAKIKMGDGGVISMHPDTEFKIDSYKFNGQQDGTERSFFSLFKGGFRSVTGLVGKLHKANYRIKTVSAVLGIRGTDHEVYLVLAGSEAAKFSPVGTYDTVYSGSTTLTNDKGTVVIEPKQMGYVAAPHQKPKLQPINTKLFIPVAEPVVTKPTAQTPPPFAMPAAAPPPAVTPPDTTPAAEAPPPVVAQPAKVEYPFEGRWSTKLVCDDTTDAKNEFIKGFTWLFDVTIDHGKLSGQNDKVGLPGSGTFTGEVQSDGKVRFDARGLIRNSEFALGKRARGSPFYFQMEGEFSGVTGHATRTAGRPCQATFTKL